MLWTIDRDLQTVGERGRYIGPKGTNQAGNQERGRIEVQIDRWMNG